MAVWISLGVSVLALALGIFFLITYYKSDGIKDLLESSPEVGE